MRELYPEIQPYSVHRLRVDAVHELHIEESGNREGIPVVFLHGGPGSGCNENHRRYFNPARYRVILFDQRGCHRSVPRGGVAGNTTVDLVQDVERIRSLLGVDRWMVYGGSWGATLGLLYAERHPDRVTAMVLRGTFLARTCDLDWFMGAGTGAGRIFPEYWAEFVSHIPAAERGDLVAAYHRRIHGGDTGGRVRAARNWSLWGTRVTTWMLPAAEPVAEDVEKILCEAAIETHYAFHRYFIEEDQVLRNAGLLPRVPISIIHGRRDLTCTLDASWSLHRALPGSTLNIVEQGGHLAGEPVMTDALIGATDGMAERLA
jgi:proline iminopeptidase